MIVDRSFYHTVWPNKQLDIAHVFEIHLKNALSTNVFSANRVF